MFEVNYPGTVTAIALLNFFTCVHSSNVNEPKLFLISPRHLLNDEERRNTNSNNINKCQSLHVCLYLQEFKLPIVSTVVTRERVVSKWTCAKHIDEVHFSDIFPNFITKLNRINS